MKHLILFILTCLLVYSIILQADPLENAVIYETDIQRFTELSYKFDWLTSYEYEIIRENCILMGVDIDLVCAIIQIESNGNPRAFNRNSNGTVDRGLCQINSIHGHGDEIYDIEKNIEFGCKYLKKCIDRYGYTYKAISAYNVGINSKYINYIYVKKVMEVIEWN